MNRSFNRRQFSGSMAAALGGISLQGILPTSSNAATRLHHPAKAKRVIFLFMHGGPSQVDTFEYKPQLQKADGKPLPFEKADNIDAVPKLMKSPWKFAQHGQSGQWVSEILPHTAKVVDELCVLSGMHSRGQSHGQAVSMMHTGSDNLVRPSLGAWISFGLGNENPDLPSFISIGPENNHGGPRNYGCAFLPAIHQATAIGRNGKLGDGQIRYLQNNGIAPKDQQRQIDLLQSLNQRYLDRAPRDERIQGSIDAVALASRMQAVAPEALSLDDEPDYIRRLYGVGEKATDNFGRQCLLARRLAERGVRFIEVSTGNVWDQHGQLKSGHEKNALATDKPIAGLLSDLKSRGLLEDTLVLWGGEFGRTPIVQGSNGRDHNPQGFTMWLAGGGVQTGMNFGSTDEYGYYAVENRVHVHDLHATMLHLLGINHEQLTYQYAGRDFRLTDVYGRVVREILG